MALVSQGFRLTVVLVDQGGNRSIQRYDLTAADFATAVTDSTTIQAALVLVTQANVLSYSIAQVYEEDADFYGSGEVENIASISARIDATEQKFATIRIPAPQDTLFQEAAGPLYNVIDPSDVALQGYLAIWETGAEALLSDGESLQDVTAAGNVVGKRIHRKSRKG